MSSQIGSALQDQPNVQASISVANGMGRSSRANALALRLEQGARALAELAGGLTPDQWQARLPGDGRKVGVVVHHVGTMYPLEIGLAQLLAEGTPIVGVSWADVHEGNAKHARENDGVEPAEAIALLEANSAAAAAAIRGLTDEQLDRAAGISLNDDAPLTCQFMLEDHAVRHAFHHLAGIRRAVAR